MEEEAYANRLILEFKAGLLPLTDGTTLRTFLSKLLNCDPMRISKKFVGNNCIGKQVFRRKTVEMNKLTMEQLKRSRDELTELERKFLDRVSQTSRCKPGVMPKLGALTQADKDQLPWMQAPAKYKGGDRAGVSAGRSMLSDGPSASSSSSRVSASSSHPGGRDPNNPLDQNLTLSQIRQPSANGGGRTTSFEALMSLDFESMQSMENLTSINGGVKVKDYKKPSSQANWSAQQQQQAMMLQQHRQAQSSLQTAGTASGLGVPMGGPFVPAQAAAVLPGQGQGGAGNLGQLLRNLSSGEKLSDEQKSAVAAQAQLHAQFQKFAAAQGSGGNYMPADIFRTKSSTGLSALRAEHQGISSMHNSSVEDFLSLVASGDIPAQDPRMLSTPLQSYIAQRAAEAKAAAAAGGPGAPPPHQQAMLSQMQMQATNSQAQFQQFKHQQQLQQMQHHQQMQQMHAAFQHAQQQAQMHASVAVQQRAQMVAAQQQQQQQQIVGQQQMAAMAVAAQQKQQQEGEGPIPTPIPTPPPPPADPPTTAAETTRAGGGTKRKAKDDEPPEAEQQPKRVLTEADNNNEAPPPPQPPQPSPTVAPPPGETTHEQQQMPLATGEVGSVPPPAAATASS